jgi:hypothetical protein
MSFFDDYPLFKIAHYILFALNGLFLFFFFQIAFDFYRIQKRKIVLIDQFQKKNDGSNALNIII